MSEYILKLYVTGDTPRAGRAIANLRKLCEAELEDRYEIIVINVLDHPELAEEEKILATPTLVRHLPPPLRRVIGDLSETGKVLLGLDIWPSAKAAVPCPSQPVAIQPNEEDGSAPAKS